MAAQPAHQLTPISVIIEMYQKPNKPKLILDKIDEISIKQQMQLLHPRVCGTKEGRNEIIQSFDNQDMKVHAHKRIRFKRILSDYHKHWLLTKDPHFTMIQNWDNRDFSLNVIIHFICNKAIPNNETADREKRRLNTTWRFVDFLRQFFELKGFDGKEFVNKHNNNGDGQKEKKTAGFGLTIVKDVCKQFDQKTGQYTKVKKQLSAWAKYTLERHENEMNFDPDNMNNNIRPPLMQNDNNNDQQQQIQSISNNNNDNNQSHNDQRKPQSIQNNNNNNNNNNGGGGGGGERWYWFCDENMLKWFPYPNNQQRVIEDAWNNGKQHCIVGERFKIELDRNGITPAGQQYNYTIPNGWRRGVIRGTPDSNGLLNGIQCNKNPK